MAAFQLSETDAWPGCREIVVVGELDRAVSAQLEAALGRAVAAGEHAVVDLTDCEFIDVSALTALVRAGERLGWRGSQLLLYGVQGQVRRLFGLTGLRRGRRSSP
jgi:anti-anti-sigma factor